MWSAVDNILYVLVHVFSHALARGGCQHTRNGSVYYVILYGLVDPFIPFCYRYFWLKLFTLDSFARECACVLKRACRCFCYAVVLLGFGYLVSYLSIQSSSGPQQEQLPIWSPYYNIAVWNRICSLIPLSPVFPLICKGSLRYSQTLSPWESNCGLLDLCLLVLFTRISVVSASLLLQLQVIFIDFHFLG